MRELLRKEFAQANPKMAARLGIGAVDREESNDPHVRRLIEAVAYLNARIRYKLEDDFPEISDALLNVFINNPDAIRLEYIKNQIVIKLVKLHSFSRFN